MLTKTTYTDFVDFFMPQRKCFLEQLKPEELTKMCKSPLLDNLEKIVFNPKENREFISKHMDSIDDVKLFMAHRECTYDMLFIQKMVHKCYNWQFVKKDGLFDYTDFFNDESNFPPVAKNIKNPKTIYTKMMEQIPQRYSGNETLYDSKYFFGTFSFDKNKVSFYSYFEKIVFDVHTMTGIPAFINYRNQHFLEFLEKADNQISYNNLIKNVTDTKENFNAFFKDAEKNIEEIKNYYSDIIKSFCINYGLKITQMYFSEKNINLSFSSYYDEIKFYKTCIISIENLEGDLEKIRDELENIGVLEWK